MARGSESYKKYFSCECRTSLMNLLEVYYADLRDFGREAAVSDFQRLKMNAVEIKDEDVFEAMEFKLSKKHANLSYADCIGYIMARHMGVKFLTGDKQFKGLPGVEFVK